MTNTLVLEITSTALPYHSTRTYTTHVIERLCNAFKTSSWQELSSASRIFIKCHHINLDLTSYDLIKRIVQDILIKTDFQPKMSWHNHRTCFLRPITTITCLYCEGSQCEEIKLDFAPATTYFDPGSTPSNPQLRFASDAYSLQQREVMICNQIPFSFYSKTNINYLAYHHENPIVVQCTLDQCITPLFHKIFDQQIIIDKQNNRSFCVVISNDRANKDNLIKQWKKQINSTIDNLRFILKKDIIDRNFNLRQLKNIYVIDQKTSIYDLTCMQTQSIKYLISLHKESFVDEMLLKGAIYVYLDAGTMAVKEFPVLQGNIAAYLFRHQKVLAQIIQEFHQDADKITTRECHLLKALDALIKISILYKTNPGYFSKATRQDPYGLRVHARNFLLSASHLAFSFCDYCQAFDIRTGHIQDFLIKRASLLWKNSIGHKYFNEIKLCRKKIEIIERFRTEINLSRKLYNRLHHFVKNVTTNVYTPCEHDLQSEKNLVAIYKELCQDSESAGQITLAHLEFILSKVRLLKARVDKFIKEHVIVGSPQSHKRVALIAKITHLLDSIDSLLRLQ